MRMREGHTVRRNKNLAPRSLDSISIPHLNTVHNFPLHEEYILASRHVTGATMPIHTTNNVRVPIYTPGSCGWRAAMWIKCHAEGQKVPGIDGNRTQNPLIQSQGFTPIYHGTSTVVEFVVLVVVVVVVLLLLLLLLLLSLLLLLLLLLVVVVVVVVVVDVCVVVPFMITISS